MKTPSVIRFLQSAALFCLFGAVLAFPTQQALSAPAPVKGRYVRVENPTGWVMVWRQIQIFSDGKEVLRGHPELFSGTVYPDHDIKTRDGAEITDGNLDTSQRGSYFPASLSETDLNPWFEVDLGETTNIDKIVLYAAEYPSRQYRDKGDRVVTVLDGDRKVIWAAKWKYYDAARYPKGVFTFEPNTSEKVLLAGKTLPEKVGGWIPMGWLLDAEEITPPADAVERMARFSKRNSPAELEKLAKEFFPLLDQKMPELAAARQLYLAEKYGEALESWKTYWFAKMKLLNGHTAVHTEYSSYYTQGEDLTNGIMVSISANSARAMRFIPGKIHWINLPDAKDDPALRTALVDCEQKAQVGKVTRPLLDAYRRDPDAKYLKMWAEVMDDWSMNFFQDATKTPYEVENLFTFNPCNQWGNMMEDLSDAAVEHPEAIALIPAATLARVQLLALEKYSTAWWYQNRYTTFIHITSGLCSWDIVLPYITEFLPGQRAMVEWRQSMERYMTMATEPDGSPTDIGDEGHIEFAPSLGFPVGKLEAAAIKPDWYTRGWRNRFMEWNDNSFKYIFRHTSPGGFDHRSGVAYRHERWTSTTKHYVDDNVYPYKGPFVSRDQEIFSIPEVRRIQDALGNISKGRPADDPDRPAVVQKTQAAHDKIKEILGSEKPGLPHINSDWMPYTGSYYFRGGWDEKDAFISMLAAGSRGGSSSLYAGDHRPMFGSFWQYDYNFPVFASDPVSIDGMPPQPLHGHFNTTRPGTKIDVLTYAEQKPAPHRWLSTEHFTVGEAVYRGAYQSSPSFTGSWDYQLQLQPEGPAVTGVESSRQILQLRKSRLFIVTDTIKTPDQKPRTFSVGYRLALSSKKDGTPFSPAQLEMNDKGLLRTNNPDGPSQSIYQYSNQPIHYVMGPAVTPDFQAYAERIGGNMGIANQRVSAEFKNATKLTLVSVLSSREKGGKERVASINPIRETDVTGFHATLQSGGQVWYRTAEAASAKLTCGPVSANCKSLLVVVDRGEVSGIVLGASSFTFNGKPGLVKDPSSQFVFSGAKMEMTGIHTPVDPVSFEPNRNSFTESETVRMVSQTPGVEIRYTTDGTPPTRNSAIYSKPITITESTEFAARAYRCNSDGKLLAADDFEINGTKFSEPTYGWFYKKESHPALELAESEVQPGLNYDYLEAPWWKLFASAHWMPARSGGTVDRELDLSKVATKESYAMRYKGYLKVPEDGLYTFHAPREFIAMDNVPGYDLRVFVDGKEWYLTQWWHGLGTWSVPLKKGFHSFQVDFADARTTPWRKSGNWNYYPRPWVIHKGNPTDILISGPTLDKVRIPADWLYRKPELLTNLNLNPKP